MYICYFNEFKIYMYLEEIPSKLLLFFWLGPVMQTMKEIKLMVDTNTRQIHFNTKFMSILKKTQCEFKKQVLVRQLIGQSLNQLVTYSIVVSML